MKIKYVIWLPFNRQTPDTWRWKKTIGNPGWWPKRIEVMEKYTIPSIKNQTHKVDAWAVFKDNIRDFAVDASECLAKNLIGSAYDKSNLTKEDRLEPFSVMQILMRNYPDADGLAMIRLDSDDMYARHAVEKIQNVPPSEGLVVYFGNGYVYDIPTDRLAVYQCEQGPMPFYSILFTRKALQSEDAYLAYREKWRLNFKHWQIKRARNAVRLGAGAWCHTWNDNNTKDATGAWKTSKHRGREILGKEKRRVKQIMGMT